MNGAIYVVDSKNDKIAGSSKIDATYLSVSATCPITCALRDKGCYSQIGNTAIHVSRLNREVESLSPLDVARAEAKLIDQCYKGGPVPKDRCLRLHVSGDSRTIAGSRLINNAVGRWKQRGGKHAWSYTHCWDHVTSDIWSNVSMLASVDSVEEVSYARDNGYAPAIVVAEHLSDKVYHLPNSDIIWIPCPAQTRTVGCVDCGLCFNTKRLYNGNYGISFAAHGVRQNVIKRRLNIIK
jgi:hypothetical protein